MKRWNKMERWIISAMAMLFVINCAEVQVKPTMVNIPSKTLIENVPLFRQGKNECGPTALSMVLNYHGHKIGKDDLKTPLRWDSLKGVHVRNMSGFQFSKYGLKTKVLWTGNIELIEEAIAQGHLVMIRHWSSKKRAFEGDTGHWNLVIGYDRNQKTIYLNDPGLSKMRNISYDDFLYLWDMSHHKSNPSNQFMIIIMKE